MPFGNPSRSEKWASNKQMLKDLVVVQIDVYREIEEPLPKMNSPTVDIKEIVTHPPPFTHRPTPTKNERLIPYGK